MFTPSKFQFFSFWVILSIVVNSQCYNNSDVWLNYGNSSSTNINDPRIEEAAFTIIELPSTVDPNLAHNDHIPDPTSEPVSAAPTPPPSSGDNPDREQHAPGMTAGDLDPNQSGNRSRKHPIDDGSSSAIFGDELPGPPQRKNLENLLINRQRKHARLQSNDNSSREDEPPSARSSIWPKLGTAAAATALILEAEKRRKRWGYIWQCCTCGISGISIQTESCPACDICRCADCRTYDVLLPGPYRPPIAPPQTKKREVRGLPLAKLPEFTDNINQRIAHFLSLDDLVHLSQSCHKLRRAYKPALVESLQLRKEHLAAELRDQGSTRETLALPLDKEELLEFMGTSRVETCSDLVESLPSSGMEPLETAEDWLQSFIHLDLVSPGVELGVRTSNSVFTLKFDGKRFSAPETEYQIEPPTRSLKYASATTAGEIAGPHQTACPKLQHIDHPLPLEVLYVPDHLTVMMSEENQQSPHSKQEQNSDGEVMSIDEQEDEDIEDLAQLNTVSKLGIALDESSVGLQDDKKNALKIPTSLMTDAAATIRSSSYSESSPVTPSLQPLLKLGTESLICPHCPEKSFKRLCDLTKHIKYHTKGLRCSIPDCERMFSRKQDLIRHENGPHQKGTE